MTSVCIIGAGWAGLAAGVELARHNIPVTIYESAKQAGGRARDVELDNITLDNGQHLMIGAYSQLLNLLRHIGVNEQDVLLRQPQHLRMVDLQYRQPVFEIHLPVCPAPFNLLWGIISCRYLTFGEKIKTLLRFNILLGATLQQDISVSSWLKNSGLPDNYINSLLKPLCLAALTTHPDIASARCFQSVLQQTFLGPREHTDLLLAKTTLGKIFPQAAVVFIESHGGKVLTGHRLESINTSNKTITVNDTLLHYDQLILATPAHITQTLLQTEPVFARTCEQLAQLHYEAVCTVYLQYPSTVQLPLPMIGCLHATSEWLFDRRFCQQPGLIAVVVSANGPHMQMENAELIRKVSAELASLFPHWPMPLWSQVIREKRACFQSSVDIDQHRPASQTAASGVHLCGDYVYIEKNHRAGLPATLEGAVRSGVQCAQSILLELNP